MVRELGGQGGSTLFADLSLRLCVVCCDWVGRIDEGMVRSIERRREREL